MNPDLSIKIKNYNSIDICRIFFAILVVAIHSGPLSEFGHYISYISAQGIGRLAVPFFFAVSGFFYIKSLSQGKKVFLKYIKRLLISYTIWSIIMFTYDLFSSKYETVYKWAIESLYMFAFCGWRQFWYLLALLYVVIIVTVVHKFHGLKYLFFLTFPLLAVEIIKTAYFHFFKGFPICDALFHFAVKPLVFSDVLFMALPFFMMGYLLNKLLPKIKNIKVKPLLILLAVFLVAYVAEDTFVYYSYLQDRPIGTVFMYPLTLIIVLICLKYPLSKQTHLAHYTRNISNFMYYSHYLVLLILPQLFSTLFHIKLTATPLFLITVAITGGIGLLLVKINNKYCNYLL